jgi:hypothetical protein
MSPIRGRLDLASVCRRLPRVAALAPMRPWVKSGLISKVESVA